MSHAPIDLLRDATARFEVMHVPPLQPRTSPTCSRRSSTATSSMATDDRDYLGRAVQALTDGRAAYVRRSATRWRSMGGTADPISALTALLSPDGALDHWCRFCYELRLHRARGYGALKAILDILAEEEGADADRDLASAAPHAGLHEGLSLVARGRRPGVSRQKRYSFTDPLLRLWVRLHCQPVAPTEEDVVREVQHYALTRVPQREAGAGARLRRRRRLSKNEELGDHRDRFEDEIDRSDSISHSDSPIHQNVAVA